MGTHAAPPVSEDGRRLPSSELKTQHVHRRLDNSAEKQAFAPNAIWHTEKGTFQECCFLFCFVFIFSPALKVTLLLAARKHIKWQP